MIEKLKLMTYFSHTKFTFNYLNKATTTIIVVVLILLPSVVNNNVMDGLQTGKFFFFCFSVLLLITVSSIRLLFSKNYFFRISAIDILFFVYVLWVTVNKLWMHSDTGFSFRFYELLLLYSLFLIIRNIEPIYHTTLLLAICISAIVQAIYGNLQLWGILSSNHNLFQVTGSFFNPGPYAGFISGCFPMAVGLLWAFKNSKNTTNKGSKTLIDFISITTIVSSILILPATKTRAAWLAAIAGMGILLWYKSYFGPFYIKLWDDGILKKISQISNVKKGIAGGLLIVVLTIICWGLYHFKKESADGRVLIWKVTLNMIKDHPITGVGADRFKAYYSDYQADFFSKVKNSPYENTASDNLYTFNEFLNTWAENGVVGLILVLLIIWGAFKLADKQKTSQPTANFSSARFLPMQPQGQLLIIARAALFSVIVFGCFAYPSEILPIKTIVVVCLAIISTSCKSCITFGNDNPVYCQPNNKQGLMAHLGKTTLALLLLLGTIPVFIYAVALKKGFETWNKAYSLYISEKYNESITAYKNVLPLLGNNGEFLFNYGKALAIAGKPQEALEVLKQSKKYISGTVYYTTLGDCYQATCQIEKATQAYTKARDINPAKLYPEYLLAKMYYRVGKQEEAKTLARKILKKQIKVASLAANEIFAEMQAILNDSVDTRSVRQSVSPSGADSCFTGHNRCSQHLRKEVKGKQDN